MPREGYRRSRVRKDDGGIRHFPTVSRSSESKSTSIHREVREKNRFRFGDNEIRMSFWSAVIPMNIGEQVCREKVAIVAGDAPFLFSKPFLQRMRAVLDLEKGQVTFNKLGVTMDLGESETGHYVNNLIPDCVDPIL